MWYVLLGAALLAADQWVKLWTAASFIAPAEGYTATSNAARQLLPGVLELTRVHNYGAAWSSFSGQRWLLLGVTCVIVAAVLWALLSGRVRHPLGRIAGVLIAAGGIGNIIDRVRLGYVIDMLQLSFWKSYPVFNVADVCVVCGAVLGAVYYLKYHEERNRPEQGGEETGDGTADPSDE